MLCSGEASCEEVGCPKFVLGFTTMLDETVQAHKDNADWIRYKSQLAFSEELGEEGLTPFTFPQGQDCWEGQAGKRMRDQGKGATRGGGDCGGRGVGEQGEGRPGARGAERSGDAAESERPGDGDRGWGPDPPSARALAIGAGGRCGGARGGE